MNVVQNSGNIVSLEERQNAVALIAESVRLKTINRQLVAEINSTVAAIKEIADEIEWRRKNQAPLDPDEMRLAKLTSREREMVTLIAASYSTKQIAHVMQISFKTAVSHRSNLMDKLDIHDVAGLTRFAIKNKIARL